MRRTLLAAVVMLVLGAGAANAAPITFAGSNGSNLAAQALFSKVSGNLVITLTNTSTADVMNPADVLTAVFFDIAGNPTLTPVSALLAAGSVVWFGPDGGGNVGGEWGYGAGLSGAPAGATRGISSSGLGLFGGGNFNGSNLQDPAALDGIQYGITSAGDNPATGNTPVTGTNALIHNSVVFTLSGLPGGFDPSASISNVSFQYGTSLTEPCTGNNPCAPVPEPASMLLLGTGLLGAGFLRRRRK